MEDKKRSGEKAGYSVTVPDYKFRAVVDSHESKGARLVRTEKVESGLVKIYFEEEVK